MPRRIASAALVLVALASARAVAAQEPVPEESARIHLGPLGLTPSIVLSSLGIDDNVFNDADRPRSDTTAAIGPASKVWLRIGRSRVRGTVGAQYLYFNEYDNQRGLNTDNDVRWDMPLSRVTPYVTGSYTNTRERPGFEIDSRARRTDTSYGAGTLLRISPKTSIDLGVDRATYAYDTSQTFLGVDLAAPLNRHSLSESVDVRLRLTPLTTFTVRNQAVQDRFETATIRNSDSFSIMPGFELRPQALISGEAFVGIRHLRTLRAELPDFTGVAAAVRTQYVVRATRIALHAGRDLAYSYEAERPYYALTDVGIEVTERLTGNWDVVGRSSRQALAYQSVVNLSLPARTDHSWTAGGGIGYRVGQTLRLGFDAVYYRRQTALSIARDYRGLRAGATVSYGLPQ